MKVSLILVAILLLSMPLILADITDIVNEKDMLRIKIYNTTEYNNLGLKLRIEFTSSKQSTYNEFFEPTISTGTGINWDSLDMDYAYFVLSDDTEGNCTILYEGIENKFLNCTENFGSVEALYIKCLSDKGECEEKYEGENATTHKTDLDACNLRVQQKDIEITGKDKDIQSLEQDKVDTKNSKWFYAIGGVLAGIIGVFIYQGKLGEAAKEKSREEFNPQQAS